jgi:hypothetical protein
MGDAAARVTAAITLRFIGFNPDNPLTRHSRAGGNPARTNIPRSGQNCDVVPLRGNFLIIWIPACAGMTQFCANDLSGFKDILIAKRYG